MVEPVPERRAHLDRDRLVDCALDVDKRRARVRGYYPVFDELMHVNQSDHRAAFWRGVGRALPDYEERRERLREVGPRLVW